MLGRDKTGHLRVVWTAQPDTFAHFQLHLRVPDGPGVHEELLPGDARQALVPSPAPGTPYELSLRGVSPEGEPSAPLIYQGIMGTSWILKLGEGWAIRTSGMGWGLKGRAGVWVEVVGEKKERKGLRVRRQDG